MKPVLYALIAMAFYAVTNVLIEIKFAKHNAFTLVACYTGVICVSSLLMRQITKTTDPSFNFPTGSLLGLVVIIGILMAAADYFYVSAYTNGGTVMTVSCIVVMFPVFASILKFTMTRAYPNTWQLCGYVCAVLAVFFISKGSSMPKP